jgi:excisionase family DNA binding protein
MTTSENELWLTLSEAAKQLGVHTTTLRRWADNGDITVLTTPGGHRRFSAADVAHFANERRSLHVTSSIVQLWATQALALTRREVVIHQEQRWLANLDDSARQRNREVGRQLMGLTLQYVSDDKGDPRFLEQAHNIGRQYGQNALDMRMPLTDALRASMFFRDALLESALNLPENVHIKPEANRRLLNRINTLLNTVHLAIAEVYDQDLHKSRTTALHRPESPDSTG